jgi:antitoxin CcdA
MPVILFEEKAPKKASNLSVNCDLLRQAKNLNINLSATLEQALIEMIREKRQEQWKLDNKDSIDAYNEHVEQHGVFSKKSRCF